MRFTFSWSSRNEPTCAADGLGGSGDSLVADIVTDNAGLPLATFQAWVVEGLARLEAVSNGEASQGEWATEVFYAQFDHERTTITSMLDESYTESLATGSFRRLLRAWIGFISGPASAQVLIVDV